MFRLLQALVCLALFLLYCSSVAAFGTGISGSSFAHRTSLPSPKNAYRIQWKSSYTTKGSSSLSMRDRSSSYWFQVGDTVKVVSDDVFKAGVNLQGRLGTVQETWEKCDVDPTCCCAEQVDENMAVRVEFAGLENDPLVAGMTFSHYFAEDELEKLTADKNKNEVATKDSSIAGHVQK